MIYIFEGKDNLASVIVQCNTLTEQEKARGIILETLPIADEVEGKHAILKANKSTNEVWYEYADIPIEEGTI